MNGPSGTGSRRQADPRPQPHQEGNDVTGGTAAIFTPVRRRASGTKGWSVDQCYPSCQYLVVQKPLVTSCRMSDNAAVIRPRLASLW